SPPFPYTTLFKSADLDVRGHVPTLPEDVSPCPQVSRNHHVHRSRIRENSPGSLTGLLALEALVLKSISNRLVQLQSRLVALPEEVFRSFVALQSRRDNRLRLRVVDIPLRHHGEGQMPVSSQLSQKSTRDTADKERHRRVLQDTEVPLVDDVLQVVLIPGRLE